MNLILKNDDFDKDLEDSIEFDKILKEPFYDTLGKTSKIIKDINEQYQARDIKIYNPKKEIFNCKKRFIFIDNKYDSQIDNTNNVFLEIYSCTNKGQERLGWIFNSEVKTDYYFYFGIHKENDISEFKFKSLYIIETNSLKIWLKTLIKNCSYEISDLKNKINLLICCKNNNYNYKINENQ